MKYNYDYLYPKFMDIFPDYESFVQEYEDSVLFDELPSKKTFSIIYSRFSGSNIGMSEESFKNRFALVLLQYYEQFEYDMYIKSTYRNLNDDEIGSDGEIIQNTTNAPNHSYNTDSMMVDGLDQQMKTTSTAGKSTILYRRELNNKAYLIDKFLENFKSLFIKILFPQKNTLWRSEE